MLEILYRSRYMPAMTHETPQNPPKPVPGAAALANALDASLETARARIADAAAIDPALDEHGLAKKDADEIAIRYLKATAKLGLALGKVSGNQTVNIVVTRREEAPPPPPVVQHVKPTPEMEERSRLIFEAYMKTDELRRKLLESGKFGSVLTRTPMWRRTTALCRFRNCWRRAGKPSARTRRRGTPPRFPEVRMPENSNEIALADPFAHLGRRRGRPRKHPVAPPRKRGGQPGNRNRLRHGAFSGAALVRREADRAELRRIDFLIWETLAWHACEQRRAVIVCAYPQPRARRTVRAPHGKERRNDSSPDRAADPRQLADHGHARAGRALAITMARHSIHATQKELETLKAGRATIRERSVRADRGGACHRGRVRNHRGRQRLLAEIARRQPSGVPYHPVISHNITRKIFRGRLFAGRSGSYSAIIPCTDLL